MRQAGMVDTLLLQPLLCATHGPRQLLVPVRTLPFAGWGALVGPEDRRPPADRPIRPVFRHHGLLVQLLPGPQPHPRDTPVPLRPLSGPPALVARRWARRHHERHQRRGTGPDPRGQGTAPFALPLPPPRAR